MGDFNHCKIELTLPGSFCVKCGTEHNRILYKCYGNVKKHKAQSKPPLSNSDRNKNSKAQTKFAWSQYSPVILKNNRVFSWCES